MNPRKSFIILAFSLEGVVGANFLFPTEVRPGGAASVCARVVQLLYKNGHSSGRPLAQLVLVAG